MTPFVGGEQMTALIDVDAPARATRRIADAGGDRLEVNVRRNTPVYTGPPRLQPRQGQARKPGTLRESVRRGPVRRHVSGTGATGYGVRVFSEDDIARYVEWNTRPHTIRPRPERGPNATLRFRNGDGDIAFAGAVRHPGTTGQHMFAIGAFKTEAELDVIAAPAVELFKMEVVR